MYEVVHQTQSAGKHFQYMYMDIYVKDRAEALAVSTQKLTQGSKLYIVEKAELFVLNDNGGEWYSAIDGTPLK